MEGQLTDLVHHFGKSNDILQNFLEKIGKIGETINRKFIVKIDVESCFELLSNKLTKNNVNHYNSFLGLEDKTAYKVNHNNNLNHICICFRKNCYLEIFIIPIEKDISEIHVNGINIQMNYFQEYLQIINNILKK